MADIRRYPFVRHLRTGPTQHVVHLRAGRRVRSGTGLSFWYRPLSAALSEVPVDDRELPLVFHARTADFQHVTVQATVAFRVVDPDVASARIDFSIDPERGTWRRTPLDQMAQVLTDLAQRHALDLIAGLPLERALAEGLVAVRDRIAAGLAAEERLQETGIGVVAVNVVAVRPEAEVERALQTPARELVQAEADRAMFERRALAVERERAISENELQSQIELATREEQLVAQRGANERRRAEEEAAAARIQVEGEAERDRLRAEAAAGNTRLAAITNAESSRVTADADAENTRVTAAAEAESQS